MNISTAREVHWVLGPHMEWEVEQAYVLALDSNLQLIEHKLISKGTLDYCPLHPRDVFRFVIQKNASRFILAHNHPSGNLLPSPQDIALTKRIIRLSGLFEIPILDHIILSRDGGLSLRASKLIRYWTL